MLHSKIPHINANNHLQFITYRLSDSLPHNIVEKIKQDISLFDEDKKTTERIKLVEKYSDKGYGASFLIHPNIADLIITNLKFHNLIKYELISWVIMPNHIHILIKQMNDNIGDIVKSWKSYTSKIILKQSNILFEKKGLYQPNVKVLNDILNSRNIWYKGYWDRYLRNEDEYWRCVEYIHNNPVKAKLVESAKEWQFSSVVDFFKIENKKFWYGKDEPDYV